MASDDPETDKIEQLKSALWLHIGQTVDETCVSMRTNAMPRFIGALTEMVWAQCEAVACDLEAFAGVLNTYHVTALFVEANETEDVALLSLLSNINRQNALLTAARTVVRHAGRTTITTDDVLLLARRSKGEGGLEAILKAEVEELRRTERKRGEKGKSARNK